MSTSYGSTAGVEVAAFYSGTEKGRAVQINFSAAHYIILRPEVAKELAERIKAAADSKPAENWRDEE